METQKMKNILAILTMILSSSTSFAAQSVVKDLGTNGGWKSAQVKEHDFSQKEACIASTKASDTDSTLELYAERLDNSSTEYVEPTVLVVTRKETSYVRAILTDDENSTTFHLTLATDANTPAGFALMSRIGERAKLVALLKKAATANVQLINAKNKVVKILKFSLKGSTKGIDAAIAGCALVVAND